MTKNKMTNLNDHLFAQLERLGAEDLTPEQIEDGAEPAVKPAVMAVAKLDHAIKAASKSGS